MMSPKSTSELSSMGSSCWLLELESFFDMRVGCAAAEQYFRWNEAVEQNSAHKRKTIRDKLILTCQRARAQRSRPSRDVIETQNRNPLRLPSCF